MDLGYKKQQSVIKRLKGAPTKKKPKFAKGILGLTREFLPSGAEFEYATVDKKTGKRGRPRGTYKKRFVPGIGIVEVPTHIYNKMMAEVRAKRRLDEAKRQAQRQAVAEELAMQTDPRYAPPTAEDSWADIEPDMDHEAEIARIKQQQLLEQQQLAMQKQVQPGLAQRGIRRVTEKARITLMGSQRERLGGQLPIQEPSYARPQLDPGLHRPREPKVSILGGKANLFGNQNLVNQIDEIPINQKTNLMNQRNELF